MSAFPAGHVVDIVAMPHFLHMEGPPPVMDAAKMLTATSETVWVRSVPLVPVFGTAKSFCGFHSVSGLTAPKLFCCCGFDSCVATQTKLPQGFHPGWHDTAWEAANVAFNGVPPPIFAMTNLEVMFLLTELQNVLASVGVVSDIQAQTLS